MTDRYACGCQPPTYCRLHLHWPCHAERIAPIPIEAECPACFNARIRSVNLDSGATPTRRER